MSAEATVAPERPASTRLLLIVLSSAVFVSVLNSSMVNVVVPDIGAEFGAAQAQVGWVITSFLLAYAISIPLYGRMSDIYSIRSLYVFGLAVFALGSLLSAVAPSLGFLVVGRIVQAVGGAAIPALGTVAVTKALAPGERGAALGLITSSVGIGAAIGPVVGGIVGEFTSWHYLFIGSMLLALILIPLSLKVIPQGDRVAGSSFDVVGGVLLGLTAGLFLFGITQGQVSGFTSLITLGSFVGAVVAGFGFYKRITTARDPFVTPSLFANSGYVLAIGVGFFAMLGNVASLVMVPLLVTSVNGLSAGLAGLVLSPGAIALAVLSPKTGKLSDSIGVKLPIIIGVGSMLASTLFLSSFGAGASPVVVSIGMMGIGIGFAFVSPSAVNAAANALSRESEHEIGAGLGIFQGAFFLGGGTGPALIGAFLAARQESGSSSINPLYPLSAPAFSDAFLAISLSLAISLAGAFFLKNRAAKG